MAATVTEHTTLGFVPGDVAGIVVTQGVVPGDVFGIMAT